MKKVSGISGVAAPLPLANVDTDVIIRIEKLAQLPARRNSAPGASRRCASCPMARRIRSSC